MSWIRENTLSWAQLFCVKVLKCGHIPKHVAFIMDGNRRYARNNNVQKFDGHSKGFDKLSETLQWCLELGIPEVTAYAFSIENFKRSKEEVDELMELTKQKLQRVLEEKDKLMEYGVRIRFIGDQSLLPTDVMEAVTEAELITKDNKRVFLNVALSYTSRNEITNVIKTLSEGCQKGEIDEEDINEEMIFNCLYTHESPFPELLIRTSGEQRLSDFLLWQTAYSYLHFTNVLWPDFTAWHLLCAIFQYQRSFKELEEAKQQKELLSLNKPMSDKAKAFISSLRVIS